MKLLRLTLLLTLILSLLAEPSSATAQSDSPQLPVYIVQEGDTLGVISRRFDVSVEDIMAVNSISDANLLPIGSRLVIPGIEGASGVLSFEAVKLGETPLQLARAHGLPLAALYKLNRVTSPSEFFLGTDAILVINEARNEQIGATALRSSGTALESAILHSYNPWEILDENQITYLWEIIPEETFYIPASTQGVQANDVVLDKLPLVQGKASSIQINLPNSQASANFDGMKINFYDTGASSVAIFGVHALKDPGLYPFHLEYSQPNGEHVSLDQLILVQSGFYPNDPPLSVDPVTLDESVTGPEEELIAGLFSTSTDTKYWDGLFKVPVDEPVCIKSWFGNRRAYNGGPYDRIHAGVDYGVCATLNIYAPADGVVIYADHLTVRGNATIIDHGYGVLSGMWHQERIFVEVGQKVSAGDLIGEIGGTGRATGPHLHWEVISNGIQVEPLDWLEEVFP